MADVVDTFMRLFRGRGDALGTWAGGCIRRQVLRPDFEYHLNSPSKAHWIGVYPAMLASWLHTDTTCSWGCVDIDNTDDPTIATNLQGALRFKGVPAWIERTDHGYHVWVFPADHLISARIMRRALHAACEAIGYHPKEVNPKQETLARGQLGNYVRLPLNGALSPTTTSWCRPLIDQDENSLDDFLANVDAFGRASTSNLDAIAKLWTPPPTNSDELGEVPPLSKQLTDKLKPRTWTIFSGGPLPGSDRSGTMVKLAKACAADGLAPAETMSVLKGAWWNKYRDRADQDEQIEKIVRNYA